MCNLHGRAQEKWWSLYRKRTAEIYIGFPLIQLMNSKQSIHKVKLHAAEQSTIEKL